MRKNAFFVLIWNKFHLKFHILTFICTVYMYSLQFIILRPKDVTHAPSLWTLNMQGGSLSCHTCRNTDPLFCGLRPLVPHLRGPGREDQSQ